MIHFRARRLVAAAQLICQKKCKLADDKIYLAIIFNDL